MPSDSSVEIGAASPHVCVPGGGVQHGVVIESADGIRPIRQRDSRRVPRAAIKTALDHHSRIKEVAKSAWRHTVQRVDQIYPRAVHPKR